MRHLVSNHGSTLVEVLVALLLLAVGLLGGSAMQLSSLRARHESALLSTATQLAASMAERMRANSTQMQAPDADNPYLGLNYEAYEAGPAGEAAGAPACLGDAACSAAQLAQFDIAEWQQQLRKDLPGARLRICRDALAWDGTAQGLQWSCSGGSGAPIVIKLGWRGRQTGGRPAQEPALPKIAMQLASGAP